MFGFWRAARDWRGVFVASVLCCTLCAIVFACKVVYADEEEEKGDLKILVALIRGQPDPQIKPAEPVLDEKIKVFRKEFVALSKKLRDARFETVDSKKVPINFSDTRLIKLDKNMEVEVTIAPLKEGKHPLKVVWYRREDKNRIKIANSLRTAKLRPEGALVPVIFTGADAPTLYVGVAIVKDEEEK